MSQDLLFGEGWYPVPTDMSLKVYKERPNAFVAMHEIVAMKERLKGGLLLYYYCAYCDGWIEGEPYERKVDTIGLLSGRQGTVQYCRRCGHEIGFVGRQS